ncbi:SGNH/GDSL hydrolase family protein [Pseudalkalibacillus caeni]|uniref:GDSL family lipase n=1 Tax=Exobacillus caeni TaxID=2574798 RepID=A0A5R9F4M3_9BACL|nr:SGNH/GDSL hydrolase family protein [Pseudalkalibacillus caeni]TLS37449.1 GDSL family lipase [Pseudalkalibacillus caeni]
MRKRVGFTSLLLFILLFSIFGYRSLMEHRETRIMMLKNAMIQNTPEEQKKEVTAFKPQEPDATENKEKTNKNDGTKNKDEADFNNNQKARIEEKEREVQEKLIEYDTKYVGLGDSLTVGIGDAEEKGYIGMVKDGIERKDNIVIDLKNYADRGDRTTQLMKILKKEKVQQSVRDADVIFLTIGGNDLMKVARDHFLSLDQKYFDEERITYQKRLEKILLTIRTLNPDCDIYYIGLFNPFLKYFENVVEIDAILQHWNEGSKQVIERFPNVYFVPVYPLFNQVDEDLFFKDNFHPNAKGYHLIANQVLAEMEKHKDEETSSD